MTMRERERLQRNRREANKHIMFMQEKIEREERNFEAKFHKDLKNCAYYPQKPALKFIPMPWSFKKN